MITPLRSIVLVLIAAFLGSIGMALLKGGAQRLRLNVPALIRNWPLWLGILVYGISSVFFVLGVKEGELTVLYPMISLGYVWALLWARLFFHERMNATKVTGLCMILGGIVVLYAGGS